MNELRTRVTLQKFRPTDVPQAWEVYNAPRPIFGDRAWQGAFITGVFYTAVDPEGPYADRWREQNRRLAAVRLEEVTEEECFRAAYARLTADYDRADVDEIAETKRDWFIQRGLILIQAAAEAPSREGADALEVEP